MRAYFCLSALLFSLLTPVVQAQDASSKSQDVVIFAAASLTDALTDIATAYEKKTQQKWRLSFAGSSTLARQIQQGAPADIFISADVDWMNELEKSNVLEPSSRLDLLANELVLVRAVQTHSDKIALNASTLAQLDLLSRIATGEVRSVPVGRYASQALTYFQQWERFKPHLVETENVRAALTLVMRGEVGYGIVYATDAALVPQLSVLGTFPAASHEPIIYPMALTRTHSSLAQEAFAFLQSDVANHIFTHYGFTKPAQKMPTK